MGAELFYADGRTDEQTGKHDESKAAVRSFANTPKTKNVKWQECTQQGVGKEGVWPDQGYGLLVWPSSLTQPRNS